MGQGKGEGGEGRTGRGKVSGKCRQGVVVPSHHLGQGEGGGRWEKGKNWEGVIHPGPLPAGGKVWQGHWEGWGGGAGGSHEAPNNNTTMSLARPGREGRKAGGKR